MTFLDRTEACETWMARAYPLVYREYLTFLEANPQLDTDIMTWLEENWPEIAEEFEDALVELIPVCAY